MTSQLELDRRRMLAGIALGLGGAAIAACGSRAGAQAASACRATPTETRGPFPADGSNGRPRPVNVLAMDGVIRRDIRGSFAGMTGRAGGVPLELEISVVGADGCRPFGDRALYLWQNDAAGAYSLYDLPGENYLRGLQAADAQGKLRFSAIVPGCYGGRYPHCHFEVFEDQPGPNALRILGESVASIHGSSILSIRLGSGMSAGLWSWMILAGSSFECDRWIL